MLKSITDIGVKILSNPITVLGLIISGVFLSRVEGLQKPFQKGIDVWETVDIGKIGSGIACKANCLTALVPGGQTYDECVSQCGVTEEEVPDTWSADPSLEFEDPFPDIKDISTGLEEVQEIITEEEYIPPPESEIIEVTTMPGIVTDIPAVISPQQACSSKCEQQGSGIGFITTNKAGTPICECEGTVGKEYSYLSDVMGQFAAGGLGSLYRTPEFQE